MRFSIVRREWHCRKLGHGGVTVYHTSHPRSRIPPAMKAKKPKATRTSRTRSEGRESRAPSAASASGPSVSRPADGALSPHAASSGWGTAVFGFAFAAAVGAAVVGVDPVRSTVWAWVEALPQLRGPTAGEHRAARTELDGGVVTMAWRDPAPAPESLPADAGLPDAASPDAASPDAGPPPHPGPWFAALVPQASVYSTPDWTKENRIGYLRRGSLAPLAGSHPIRTHGCDLGWFKLVGGGYVCAKQGTLDVEHPKVKLGPAPPNLEEPLPYQYGWNTTMGTPLYRSVPSREQMAHHEPYLRPQDADRSRDGLERAGAVSGTFFAAANPAAAAPERRVWWQSRTVGGKPDIRLADLVEADDNSVVSRRLVRGFYIAIDKSFSWNGRDWYETTSSMVAPADWFSVAKPASLHGVELAGTDLAQPVAFILSTSAKKYRMSGEPPRRATADGPVDRFTAVRLSGESIQVGGVSYKLTTEGWWMRGADGTYTDPGPPPEGLAPGEKWVDVNLSRQSLVAFEGTVPVFASLVSTGRHARDPSDRAHDHRTVQGIFRVREKHLATTMDGDGPAPGDMPYSIEDVPYVMYFEGSYALHAAFWHTNFGHEQSHGCVNLAPLDAKRLFSWADPPLPQGWHGVWASKDRPGTTVVVHE